MSSSKTVARCRHVNTAGVQCGSPAVTKTRLCYYHHQGRSTSSDYYAEAPYCIIEEDLPLFEDAHSIQIAIRRVASLLIENKIEHKTAGLLLYSMQLALMNLKQFQGEKPQPAQIVVDPEALEETMPEPERVLAAPAPLTEAAAPEAPKKPALSARARKELEELEKEALIQDQLDYLMHIGNHLDDPCESPADIDMDLFIAKKRAARAAAKAGNPPGTIPEIQGCAAP